VRRVVFFAATLPVLFLSGMFRAPAASAATRDVAPGGSISGAIDRAEKGDIIRLAPGTYRGPVSVGKPGLTITSATPPGGEPDVVIESQTSPALTDAQDTVWRGVSFRTGGDGPIANLTGFRGRVEYCRFEFEENRPGRRNVVISGGSFHGTAFANQRGGGEGVVITAGDPLFTYCRFENLEGGSVLLQKGSARFRNCLFASGGHILKREAGAGGAEMTNCVLFLNAAEDLFPGEGSSAVRLDHCVYTPARRAALGGDFSPIRLPKPSKRFEISDTRTVSPRFRSPRRRGTINLGIDDTRCIPLWSMIAAEADKYGYPITTAVHVARLSRAHINLLRRGHERGHEIGSHGVSHAPFNLDGGIEASYAAEGVNSAFLSLEGGVLRVVVDDRVVDEIGLGSPDDGTAITLGALVTRLRRVGVRAELTGDSYRDIPAAFLTRVRKFDIRFKNFSPTLGIQTQDFMKYEIAESRTVLDKRLGFPVQTMIYPYTEYTPSVARETEMAGYLCARGGNNAGTYSPYRDGVLVYRIYAENLKNVVSPADLPEERMREETRMMLDCINDEGAVISLYSHDEDELSFGSWQVLLKTIHEDGFTTVAKLSDLAEKVVFEGTHRGERYFLTPPPSMADYHPRDGSPLLGAGKPLGIARDYEGKPLPPGNPSIGLYK
jgi:hypothetical protein